jgi:phosphoenolpyruvate---glycerone phosphotransferase subunit DhaK
MELYIVYRKLVELLGKARIAIYHPYLGNYFTSLEMMGVTVTMMKLDAELKELIAAEATSIGLTQPKLS